MTDVVVKPKRASLWREGIRTFYSSRKEWARLAAIFFLVLLPISYGTLWEIGKYSIGNPAFLGGIFKLMDSLEAQDSLKHHPVKAMKGDLPQELSEKDSQQAREKRVARDRDALMNLMQRDKPQQSSDKDAQGNDKNAADGNAAPDKDALLKLLQGDKPRHAAGKDSQDDDVVPFRGAAPDDAFLQLMEEMQNGNPYERSMVAVQWGSLIFVGLQLYMFYGFFMKREGVTPHLKSSVKGFFYFLGMAILWFLLIMALSILIAILCLIIGGLLLLIIHFLPTEDKAKVVLSGIGIIALYIFWIGSMIYVSLRYTLVTPLAAAHIQSPIKTSGELMRKNIWRMFFNYLLLYIIFFLPLMAVSFALYIDFGAYGVDNIPVGIFMAALLSLISLFFGVFFSAFRAAACRILYEEKRLADTTFVLSPWT